MRTFFKTVAIVTVFSVAEKILGFLYRIFLSQSIGEEGIGLYQVALSVFGLLYTACCSGTPVTVSRLITKHRSENNLIKAEKVISAGLSLTLATAIPVCLVFIFFGKGFTFLFADPRCYKVFLIILPGLIFTSVYSVLRGVFWGYKDFLPYSIIELLEEICMICCGIFLINRATSVYQGAVRAGVAVLISYVFSFTLSIIVFVARKNKLRNPISELKPLILSSAPVTAMRTANSLAVSLVSVILPLRLVASGMSSNEAMTVFGAACGQALPILFIPTTLIGSFTLVLIPEIAENYYKKQYFYLKRDIEKAIKLATCLTTLFIPVFFVCGEEIGVLVFKSVNCGKYLSVSAFLMLFMSLSNLSTSMLNSIGLEHKTLSFYIVGGGLMLLSVWFLPSMVGIYALLIGFSFVYGLTSVLNLRLLNKNCPLKPKYLRLVLGSSLTVIPTAILGLMLEKMLLPVLGTFFNFAVCSAIMMIFNCLLFFGFSLVEFKSLSKKIKGVLKKSPLKKTIEKTA